jgi:uncharacterized protein
VTRRSLRVAAGLGERLIAPLGAIYDEVPAQASALGESAYRPWPAPARPWLMGQTWRELLFAHWAVAPERLRAVVPPPLELDLRDGRGWIGVTPFRVTGLRVRGTPPPPLLSRFLELNVRTYVVGHGRPGIYFFSLDASSRAAVAAARRGYRLPYFHARIAMRRERDQIHYRAARVSPDGPPAGLEAVYGPSGRRLPLVDGSLERWLTERYRLYTLDGRGRVLSGDIHHRPWPLRPATASIAVNTMAAPLGLELAGEPLLHYSARQDTLFWALERA